MVYPSRQCSSTPVGFGQGFLSKEYCDNSYSSLILSWPGSIWFLLVPWNSIRIAETAFLLRYWHHSECDGELKRIFTKWLLGKFPTYLESLAEVLSRTSKLFWRKYKLIEWTVFLFFSNEVIPGTLVSHHVLFTSHLDLKISIQSVHDRYKSRYCRSCLSILRCWCTTGLRH
jgi:hypothetical protein